MNERLSPAEGRRRLTIHCLGSWRESAAVNPKEQFVSAFERECATTMRVLRAYPADKLELRPHAKCKTARELA